MGTPVVISEGAGRAAQQILDDVTHIAVGTGSTSPVLTDSQLEEETNRQAVTTTLRSGGVIEIHALFANANLPTTTKEMGLFLNGSGSSNTGDMLLRVAETFVKGSSDLLAVFTVTLS